MSATLRSCDSNECIGVDYPRHVGSAPPSTPHLYRHVLESICAFLDCNGLAQVLHVSRDWMNAVQSMGRLELSTRVQAVGTVMTRSPIARHITDLDLTLLGVDGLGIFTSSVLQLRRLKCALPLPVRHPVRIFPTHLRELELVEVQTVNPSVVDLTPTILAVGMILTLETFTLTCKIMDSQTSFSALQNLSRLRDLSIQCTCLPSVVAGFDFFELSDNQIDELRSMPHLQRLFIAELSPGALPLLLRQPHNLQWTEVSSSFSFCLTNECVDLFAQLPSLTTLAYVAVGTRFDFLARLSNLTHVDIKYLPVIGGPPERSILNNLVHCNKLESLMLGGFLGVTMIDLEFLLSHLLQLKVLGLANFNVESLSFLCQSHVTQQLIELHLYFCEFLQVVDVRHIHALNNLQTLIIEESFSEQFDASTITALQPPSVVMPQLKTFRFTPSLCRRN